MDPPRPDLSSPAPRPDLGTAPRRLLNTFSGCPKEMFDSPAPPVLEDDFDSQAQLDVNWNWKNDGRFPRPRLEGGSLVFGPHNLNPNEWWNNWTPVHSLPQLDEAMYCVRYRVKPPSGVDGGDSVFNTWLRGGMTIALAPVRSMVVMNTRTSDTTWDEHGSAPLAFKQDVEQTVEVVIYGLGTRYYAEVKNVDSGELVALAVTYDKLPAKADVGMLGWRLKNPLYVDRAVAGLPAQGAREILTGK